MCPSGLKDFKVTDVAVHVPLRRGFRGRNNNKSKTVKFFRTIQLFPARHIPPPFIPPPAGDTGRLFTPAEYYVSGLVGLNVAVHVPL